MYPVKWPSSFILNSKAYHEMGPIFYLITFPQKSAMHVSNSAHYMPSCIQYSLEWHSFTQVPQPTCSSNIQHVPSLMPFFDPDCVGRPSNLESWTTHDAEPWTGCTNFRSGGQTIKMNRIKIGYFFKILFSVICQKKATNLTWRDPKTWGRLFD